MPCTREIVSELSSVSKGFRIQVLDTAILKHKDFVRVKDGRWTWTMLRIILFMIVQLGD